MTGQPSRAPFRRAELEAGFAERRRRTPGPLFFFGPSAAVAAAIFLLRALVPSLRFDAVQASLWFAGPLAVIMLVIWNARAPSLNKELGLVCPQCGHEFALPNVVRTGYCGSCGAQLLDPTEVEPPKPEARVPLWRNAVGVTVLVTLTAWLFYKAFAANRQVKRLDCRDRYGIAHTARDTLRVDRRCAWTRIH